MNAGAKNKLQTIWPGKPGGPEANRVREGERGGAFNTQQMPPAQGDNLELFELSQLRQRKADALEWLKPMVGSSPKVDAAAAELLRQYDALEDEIKSLGTSMYVRGQMKADEAKRNAR